MRSPACGSSATPAMRRLGGALRQVGRGSLSSHVHISDGQRGVGVQRTGHRAIPRRRVSPEGQAGNADGKRARESWITSDDCSHCRIRRQSKTPADPSSRRRSGQPISSYSRISLAMMRRSSQACGSTACRCCELTHVSVSAAAWSMVLNAGPTRLTAGRIGFLRARIAGSSGAPHIPASLRRLVNGAI